MLAPMGGLGTAAHVVRTFSYWDGGFTMLELSGYVRLVWAAAAEFLLVAEFLDGPTWASGGVTFRSATLLLHEEIRMARVDGAMGIT